MYTHHYTHHIRQCFKNQKNFLFAFVFLVFLSSPQGSFAQNADVAQKLGDPIAYCLSTLAECTPDKQKAFEGKVPGGGMGYRLPKTLWMRTRAASTCKPRSLREPRLRSRCHTKVDILQATWCTYFRSCPPPAARSPPLLRCSGRGT